MKTLLKVPPRFLSHPTASQIFVSHQSKPQRALFVLSFVRPHRSQQRSLSYLLNQDSHTHHKLPTFHFGSLQPPNKLLILKVCSTLRRHAPPLPAREAGCRKWHSWASRKTLSHLFTFFIPSLQTLSLSLCLSLFEAFVWKKN